MPTLEGVLPDRPGPTAPCRWCGAPTDLTMAPEGSRVGPVPLHMLCAAVVIRAYKQGQRGFNLAPADRERMARFLRPALPDSQALTDGHAAAPSNVRSARQDLQ